MAGLGSATCESCKAGHFAATVGSRECHLCRAGSYAAAGSHECSRCPPGTYSSIAATNCTPCQEGWVAEGWGNPTCKPCLAGTYAHEGRLCRQCPGNTISTLGRSKCEPCVGSFLLAYADAERVTCHASMTSLFVGLMTAVCLIIALMLSAWLCFYQLHIEDLSLQATACQKRDVFLVAVVWCDVFRVAKMQKVYLFISVYHGLSSVHPRFSNQDHGLVVTTSRPHRLLWRWGACITLKNTGSQPLEDLQKRRPYRARTLSGRENPGVVVKTGENIENTCWIRGPMVVMLKFHRERVGSKGRPCPVLLSGKELQLIHDETKLNPSDVFDFFFRTLFGSSLEPCATCLLIR